MGTAGIGPPTSRVVNLAWPCRLSRRFAETSSFSGITLSARISFAASGHLNLARTSHGALAGNSRLVAFFTRECRWSIKRSVGRA
jgi:hypothetical protein